MESRHVFILLAFLILLDFIFINCSFITIFHILSSESNNNSLSNPNLIYLIMANATWILAVAINYTYSHSNIQTTSSLLKKSGLTFITQQILMGSAFLLINPSQLNNLELYHAMTFEFLGIVLVRMVIYLTERYHPWLDSTKKKILIIGDHDLVLRLEQYFLKHTLSFSLAGSFPDYNTTTICETNSKQISRLNDSVRYAIENKLDEVYTTQFPEKCADLDEVLNLAEKHCVRVKYVTSFMQFTREEEAFRNSNYRLKRFYDGIPILVNRKEPLSLISNRIIKRLFDIVFSLLVIIFLLSWFLPLMIILIRLESKGEAIFMQLRSGKNSLPFYCLKFRSMNMNKDSNNLQATRNDPRITSIGAFMRKTSIDELPQFFNVLLGNMSVVGPRPHMLKHTEEYSELIEKYMVRHFLKPGITGWAQINGFRGETKHHAQMLGRVKHDIWYMENWSLFQDLKIIYKTVSNAISGEDNAF